MKNTIKYISAIFAAMLIMAPSFVANAIPLPPDEDDGVRLYKQLSEPDANGLYTITLDAFVTGSSTTIHSEEVKACDIVLVLDLSRSMTSNNVNIETKGDRLSTGNTLSRDTNYKIVLADGEYYLKMFRSGQLGNRKYDVRIRKDQVPTSSTDGQILPGTSTQMSSAYKVTSTDEIYPVSTSSVTRLKALQTASSQFMETVNGNQPTNTSEHHKVALVGFNKVGGTIQAFTDVTDATVNELKTKIDGITTGMLSNGDNLYTNPASGLYQAAQLIEGVKNDGRPKVVVFFTDGNPCPSGTNDFNDSYGRAATNISYVLKQPTTASFNYTFTDPVNSSLTKKYTTGYGAKVYSVAILSSENNYIRRFLHFVSSNYPNQRLADSYNFPNNKTGEGGEDPHDYYQLSNGSDLTAIFDKIAQESSEGSATTKLEASTTQVVDVMSTNFTLPTGVTVNDIDVHVESFVGNSLEDAAITDRTNEHYNDIWVASGTGYYYVGESDGQSPAHVGPYATIGKVDGKDQVIVHNFNFSKDDAKVGGVIDYNTDGTVKTPGNWVGSRDRKPGTSGPAKLWYGNKLVIQFKVKLNPDYEPGYGVPSNDPSSGIKVLKDGNWTTQWFFEVPSIDVPGLCILKDGLNVGESSIFNVTNSDASKNYRVALTQRKAAGASGGKLACYSILKVGQGTFTVTENTNWSWTYTPDGAISKEQEIKELTKEQVSNIKTAIINGSEILYSNENIALGKTATVDGVKYCILNDAEGEVTEEGSVVVLYYFKNAKTVTSPGNAETLAHNVFKGGTRNDAPNVEIGGEEVEDM